MSSFVAAQPYKKRTEPTFLFDAEKSPVRCNQPAAGRKGACPHSPIENADRTAPEKYVCKMYVKW